MFSSILSSINACRINCCITYTRTNGSMSRESDRHGLTHWWHLPRCVNDRWKLKYQFTEQTYTHQHMNTAIFNEIQWNVTLPGMVWHDKKWQRTIKTEEAFRRTNLHTATCKYCNIWRDTREYGTRSNRCLAQLQCTLTICVIEPQLVQNRKSTLQDKTKTI